MGVNRMKVFTYSEARQNLAKILQIAKNEEVEIRRKDGSVYSLKAKVNTKKSPFDVAGVRSKVTTEDIVEAVRQSREG